MSFLPRYLIAAIIGTVAVYAGAPFLRQYLPAPDDANVESEGRGNREEGTGDEEWGMGNGEWGMGNGERGTENGERGTGNGESDTTPTMQRPNDATMQRPNDATMQRPNEQTSPRVIVENVRGYTPSTERIRASGRDVTYWGVTIVDTPFYDRDGKLRDEKLPGGTLVEQTASTKSSRGEMALCRIWRNGNWAGSYLVATSDLIRFDGGREKVDANDVDNLCAYYGLNAAFERRKEELVQKAAAANPYFAELKQKATVYNEHRNRAKELTAERNTAKGAARNQIIAELTRLKNAEAREAAEVQSLTRKYEDWKKAHAATTQVNPATDPVCKGCLDKMENLKPKLAVFGI